MGDSAVARFAGSGLLFERLPGACAPGSMLSPASQVERGEGPSFPEGRAKLSLRINSVFITAKANRPRINADA